MSNKEAGKGPQPCPRDWKKWDACPLWDKKPKPKPKDKK